MKIVACNSNRPLAEAVAAACGIPLTNASVRRFADMEVFVEIHENIRGEDVFVVQSTSYPANDNLMELLITLDALKRSSARRITAVIPYFGYARQDRKSGPRTPMLFTPRMSWQLTQFRPVRPINCRPVSSSSSEGASTVSADDGSAAEDLARGSMPSPRRQRFAAPVSRSRALARPFSPPGPCRACRPRAGTARSRTRA